MALSIVAFFHATVDILLPIGGILSPIRIARLMKLTVRIEDPRLLIAIAFTAVRLCEKEIEHLDKRTDYELSIDHFPTS